MTGFNAAAMLKAVLAIRKAMMLDSGDGPTNEFHSVVDALTQAALAAPPRNCDRFGWRDAWEKWRTENHPKKPVTYKEAYDSTVAFMDWFMGTAEKGGAQ